MSNNRQKFDKEFPKIKAGIKYAFIDEHPEYAAVQWAKMLKFKSDKRSPFLPIIS